MHTFILVVHVIIAVCLVAVILMQRSEGGALSGLGGDSGSFMSGRSVGNMLTRMTAVLATCFMITSITLAIMSKGDAAKTQEAFMQTAPVVSGVVGADGDFVTSETRTTTNADGRVVETTTFNADGTAVTTATTVADDATTTVTAATTAATMNAAGVTTKTLADGTVITTQMNAAGVTTTTETTSDVPVVPVSSD